MYSLALSNLLWPVSSERIWRPKINLYGPLES